MTKTIELDDSANNIFEEFRKGNIKRLDIIELDDSAKLPHIPLLGYSHSDAEEAARLYWERYGKRPREIYVVNYPDRKCDSFIPWEQD